MKKQLLSALCFAGIAAAHAQCKIDYSNYHLILNEEFNTSIADLGNRWFFDTGDPNWPGAGIEYYDPNQISLLPGGFLRLKATQVTPFVLTMPNGRTRTLKYKSGILRSKIAVDPGGWPGNDGVQYGIFEMRAKIPKGRTAYGTGEWDAWPAFWLTSGPTEIDIMDDIQPDPSRVWQMGLIDWTKYPNGNPTDWDLVCDCNTDPGNALCGSPDFHSDIAYAASSLVKYDNKVYRSNKYVKKCSTGIFAKKRGVDLSSDYFTYTGVWTPDKVTFFLNGTEVATISSSNIATTPFPTRIIANLEMMEGGSDPEYVMDIDYIRIWKPNNNNYALPYKSANEFMNHDVFQNIAAPLTGFMPNAIAVNPNNGNEVFYRDQNNYVCVAKRNLFSSPAWSVSSIPFNDGPVIPVAGDMRYLPQMNALIYVGSNNRINLFGRSTVEASGFYHWYITSNYNCWWCVTDDYVSSAPGSLQTSDNGEIFFRGTDNKMHRYYPSNGTWVHQVLPAYSNDELISGDIIVESPNNTVYYRGNDGRLQCFYKNNGNYVHTWIDPAGGTSATLVSSAPGSMVVATGLSGVLYIGTDYKIHLYYWDVTWKHLLLPYNYSDPGLGYPNADLALNSVTWDKVAQRLYYNGFDGRIQAFGKTNGQWWHNWVDAYWNTDEFVSFNTSDQLWNGPKYASTTFGPLGIFYTRRDNHLAYFRYENCEILNPPTGYSPNAARPAPDAEQEDTEENTISPMLPAKYPYLAGYASAGSRHQRAPRLPGDQLVVSPNPSQDGIFHLSVYIPGATGNYRLEVSDMLGNIVYTRDNVTANATIDLSRQAAGTYFIRVQSGNATLQGKLIRNR